MGGRGSGGSRGGGGASKSIDAKTENKLNSLLNQSYKYDDEAQARADKAKIKAKQYLDEASKLASKKIRDIPRTYQYKGEKGVRTVYKSPQNARKAYEQSRQNLVSTAYRDHPTIVESPKGGYSVMPHGIAKLNKLKEISPYSIDMGNS